jgi:hypothetical protein
MKTIVRNDNNISLYLFDDSQFVNIAADITTVGNPAILYIDDCNSSNVTLFENVTNPEGWVGWKYFYTVEDGWVLNPNWVPPEEPQEVLSNNQPVIEVTRV